MITYYADKSFSLELKTPPASYFLKKAAGLKPVGKRNRPKASVKPGKEVAGTVTLAQVREIAEREDEGPQRDLRRGRHADHHGLGEVHGHRGEGLMAKIGKRLKAAQAAFEGKENLAVADAVALVKANASAKFDETVEIAVNLGVDPRHADQMVRGTVNLPNGTGKTVRVAVFARGDKADEARAAGADIVGAEDLMQ